MFVGILQVSLQLAQPRSLKEKRRIVKSILDRIRSRFNASAAEIGSLDDWKSADLGFCAASNDARYVQGLMQKILNQIEGHPEARVDDYQLEVI